MAPKSMKTGFIGGIAGVITVAAFTTFGYTVIGQPLKVLLLGCQIYMAWVSAGILPASMVASRYWDKLPGATMRQKALYFGHAVGFPVFLTGQLLPWTRAIDAAYGPIPQVLALPANMTFFLLGGPITMGVVFYVFQRLEGETSHEHSDGVPA